MYIYMCVCVCVCVCVCAAQKGCGIGSIFKRNLTGLISEFSFSKTLPIQGQITQSVLQFTHSRRENNWIHTFPKSISAM